MWSRLRLTGASRAICFVTVSQLRSSGVQRKAIPAPQFVFHFRTLCASTMSKRKREIQRCQWTSGGDEKMVLYHDEHWGRETRDDKTLFEFLILESAQAGLSWRTILNKREGYAKAFADFDVDRVAKFKPKDIERLLNDASIVRNKLKINAAVNNAKIIVKMRDEEDITFSDYLWSFVPANKPIKRKKGAEMKSKTDLSDEISKDMRKRGFQFVGSTTIYSLLQSCGLVNDHDWKCEFREP